MSKVPKPTTKPRPRATRPTASVKSNIKRYSIMAALVSAITEAGAKNVLASTALTLVGPLTAAGFVYEVSAMRNAALIHEAIDRAEFAARDEPVAALRQISTIERRDDAPVEENPNLGGRVDTMLESRAAIIDLFGSDPDVIAPVYVRVIKSMLIDDERTFALISDKKSSDPSAAAGLSEKEAKLRDVHEKLSKLVGARMASNAP